MISGVRASSIRIESTSSTIAKIMTALDTGREVKLHVVAQVVEAEFVVGAVGDVGGIGSLSLEIVHVVLDTADFQTEEAMNLAHPLRVARSEIIVHGNDVNAAAAGQRVQVGRQRGDQRFAFTGAHLGDLALVQDDAADQLHVEVAHAGSAHAGFSDDGKSFRQNLVERLALDAFAFVFVR